MKRNVYERLRDRLFHPKFKYAQKYVGTIEFSGQIQLSLLKLLGLKQSHDLLDIGCGSLNLGFMAMEYLDAGRFHGVDPNEWLRETAIKRRKMRALIEEKKPSFASNDQFDGSSFGKEFDFIFSHSVLSHAADFQLNEYFANAANVLSNEGAIVVSLMLAEGNNYGNAGTSDGSSSGDTEWVYPGVSYFDKKEIAETADKNGLTVEHRPDLTALYTTFRPTEYHDWVVLRKSV